MAEWNDGLLSGRIREQQGDLTVFWAYCLMVMAIAYIVLSAVMMYAMVAYDVSKAGILAGAVPMILFGAVLAYFMFGHGKVLDKMNAENKAHWNEVYGPVFGCDFDEYDRRMKVRGRLR